MQKTTAYGWLVIVAMMIMAYFFINAFIKIAHDPGVPFLISEGGAEWIRIERPVSLAARQGNETVSYRRVFTLEREIPEALLVVRALRTASVYFDGQAILPFGRIEDWKIPRTVSLKGYLTPGVHELRITVINRNGPAILLAHSKALDLFTGKNWHASLDGSFWRPVLTVAEKKPVELSQRFPDTFSALGSLLYVYLPFFLLCLAAILLIRPALERHGMLRKLLADPPSVRWLLAGLWILLAVNNITKIPLTVGFDHWAHYEYITYIAEKWTLPLANEGWQMFQPPVFYLIAALLSKLLSLFASP
jgi:hypothetical protein